MKNLSFIYLFVIAIMILTSCEDQMTLSTTIGRDGSCDRCLTCQKVDGYVKTVHLQESELADSAWLQTEWQGGKDTVYVNHTRHFDSVEEMERAFPLQINGQSIAPRCSWETRFRWFYTEYTYTEVYPCLASDFDIPLSNYMDEENARYWLQGGPDLFAGHSAWEIKGNLDDMELDFARFFRANLMYDIVGYLVEHYDMLPDPPVSREVLVTERDSIAAFAAKDADSKFEILSEEKVLNEYFHTQGFEGYKKSPVFSGVEYICSKKYEEIATLGVKYQLHLPGEDVRDAGCGVVKSDCIEYVLTGTRLLVPDFTITATTRERNTWAYIVTVVLAMLAFGSLVFVGRKCVQ